MSDIGEACDEVFLDGCGRPWGRTPKPQVDDPWNWIPDFKPSGELAGHIRVRRGPAPPPDAWPTAPPPYEGRVQRVTTLEELQLKFKAECDERAVAFAAERIASLRAQGPAASGAVKAPLTANLLWTIHRAALGGRSSVTGAELPRFLDECPPGARAAHYALALAAAWHVDRSATVPVPEGVSPDEATRIEMIVAELLGNDAETR